MATRTELIEATVATAGAQIMRYWNWPPNGVGTPYNDWIDWANMPDDFAGCDWNQTQVDAVAELCHKVGIAVGMDYGCIGSGATTSDMEGVYENYYRYSTLCTRRSRNDYTQVGWFNLLKDQFNLNRPVQYRVTQHSIVGDGWQETVLAPPHILREYHMNYGGEGPGSDTWYTLDGLPLGGIDEEYALINIHPACALGSWLSGGYEPPSFPYRYFDRDATGDNAVFNAGHYLQFLPSITVTCTSTTGGKIEFRGLSTENSHLFTRGDELSTGINIYNGHVYLYQGGSIKFH